MKISDIHSEYISLGSCRDFIMQAYDIVQKNPHNSIITPIVPQNTLAGVINICDEHITSHTIRPLEGIPISLKDVLLYEGIIATGGSKILQHYTAPYSATVVQRLVDAGAIILAKDNCDMFGHGSTNTNTHYGPVEHTTDASRTPGGSSGGTAVTVAIGGSYVGIGSDTGGSIRQPAVYNGLVGFKPSYGAVSRYGLMSYASSLDTVGPIAHNVSDIIDVMNVIGGKDDHDPTSIDYHHVEKKDLESYSLMGKKVAFYTDFIEYSGLDPAISTHINEVKKSLQQSGVEIVEVPFFPPDILVATYYVIAMAETASNLSRLTGVGFGEREGHGSFFDVASHSRAAGLSEETKKRIIIGNQILSAGDVSHYYAKAQAIRKDIKQHFEQVFEQVDFVISPVSPHIAPEKNAQKVYSNDDYMQDMYTVGFSLGGNPTLALPTMPLSGIQISGKVGCDDDVLKYGYHVEQILLPYDAK